MKKNILLLAKIILSALILVYLFSIIPVSEIWVSIQLAETTLVFLGIILIIPITYLSAFETQYLTRIQGMTLEVFEIVKILLVTNFYGFFLPGILSGGAIKWYKLSKYGKKSSAAAIVVFNRFLETLIIVLLGILFSFPVLYNSENQAFTIILGLILLLLVILYFLILNKPALNFIKKIFLRLLLPNIIKEKTGKFMEEMQQFQSLRLKDHLEIIGLMILYHGIGIFAFFCFTKALNIDISIWVIGWVRSAMTIAIMLPFSFAGLGIREGTLVYLLGHYGVMPSDSMALSFLFLFRSVLTSLAGGLFEFKNFAFSKQLKKIKS